MVVTSRARAPGAVGTPRAPGAPGKGSGGAVAPALSAHVAVYAAEVSSARPNSSA